MKLEEGKERFIQSWGTLGSAWGINRTMAQIHALLLVSPEPLSAQEIMDELKISLGNANMNLRALVDWGLIYKHHKPGERKDFFVAEKDMWVVVKKIAAQRKKRELEPVLKVLEEVESVEGTSPEAEAFKNVIKDIRMFSENANKSLETFIQSDSNWFMSTFMKMMR
ncbi:MAG: transcriptional regulator [Bacteroidetes bacterium]|nr:MAG: transcriptional regulator [Bacteroidota bacterium]